MHQMIRSTGKAAFALSVLTGMAASPTALDATCDCQWNGQCYSQGSRICFGWVMVCKDNGNGFSWEYIEPHQSCK
jgi:hypothetical protein